LWMIKGLKDTEGTPLEGSKMRNWPKQKGKMTMNFWSNLSGSQKSFFQLTLGVCTKFQEPIEMLARSCEKCLILKAVVHEHNWTFSFSLRLSGFLCTFPVNHFLFHQD
jgi:hypothetical protein